MLSGWVSPDARSGFGEAQRSAVPQSPEPAARAVRQRADSRGPAPVCRYWTGCTSVGHCRPMGNEPELVVRRQRVVRGRRATDPACGWPGNGLRSRLRPLPAAARCGAGGPACGRRGRAEEGARAAERVCHPRTGHVLARAPAPRVVQNRGATAPRSRPRPAGCSSTDARSRAREVSERAHQRPRRAQLNPGLGARLGLTPPPPGPEPGAFVLGTRDLWD